MAAIGEIFRFCGGFRAFFNRCLHFFDCPVFTAVHWPNFVPFVMGGNMGFRYCGPRVVFVGVGGVTAFGLRWTRGHGGCWLFTTTDRGGRNARLMTGFSGLRTRYTCVLGGTMIAWVAKLKK